MSKTVLILSPYFPPSTLAGVHRARLIAKHLPAVGWRPLVLCVDDAYHREHLDPDLAMLVPASVEIIKAPAVSVRTGRLVGVGDASLRGMRGLRQKLNAVLESQQIHAVLITGGPFYPMLFTPSLRRKGIPVVLDFQDPWVSAWGASQPAWSKAGLSHRLATVLEPRALRHASFVTSVSETQNAEMSARYPWLDASGMAAIPIGGDPEDFEYLRNNDVSLPDGALDPSFFNLSFVGTFMPRSGPLMRLVLAAAAELRRTHPEIGAKLRLNFIGTSNQPGDHQTERVIPIAREAGIAEAVREIPQRVPFLQALATLARSDAILLVGSDEPHYTASKIYPALMSGRPFLSFFHGASSSHRILAAAGGGVSVAWEAGLPETSLIRQLSQGLSKLIAAPESLGRADPAAYAAYEARAIARRYAEILTSVSNPAPAITSS